MRKIIAVVFALSVGFGASLAVAPSASAFCVADPGTGGPCGRCPELKIIKIYCLQ